jgi:hypothetical protein
MWGQVLAAKVIASSERAAALRPPAIAVRFSGTDGRGGGRSGLTRSQTISSNFNLSSSGRVERAARRTLWLCFSHQRARFPCMNLCGVARLVCLCRLRVQSKPPYPGVACSSSVCYIKRRSRALLRRLAKWNAVLVLKNQRLLFRRRS